MEIYFSRLKIELNYYYFFTRLFMYRSKWPSIQWVITIWLVVLFVPSYFGVLWPFWRQNWETSRTQFSFAIIVLVPDVGLSFRYLQFRSLYYCLHTKILGAAVMSVIQLRPSMFQFVIAPKLTAAVFIMLVRFQFTFISNFETKTTNLSSTLQYTYPSSTTQQVSSSASLFDS